MVNLEILVGKLGIKMMEKHLRRILLPGKMHSLGEWLRSHLYLGWEIVYIGIYNLLIKMILGNSLSKPWQCKVQLHCFSESQQEGAGADCFRENRHTVQSFGNLFLAGETFFIFKQAVLAIQITEYKPKTSVSERNLDPSIWWFEKSKFL